MAGEETAMGIDEPITVHDWVAHYRDEYGLAVAERGGYLMLPITGRLGVVHVPAVRAHRVRAALDRHGSRGPVLARQIRWSFLAEPDIAPGPQVLESLGRSGIGLPGIGSAVMLPTGFGRWTREGCHWVIPPERDAELPALSTVLRTALAATA
ncbi:hypothetical protein [Nocardia sp. NPDC057227]|uniref:hypothetical protein n=1 Tax=Nocardia sp. NPDC057227 TaxID=3346056 RepID=UPI00363E7A4D